MNSLAKIAQQGCLTLQVEHETLQVTGELLAHLAPLFPAVASATRTDAGAAAWIKSWSTQIQLSGLKKWQIARGLTRLHEHDQDIPLTWPAFYKLCKNNLRDDDVGDGAEQRWRDWDAYVRALAGKRKS